MGASGWDCRAPYAGSVEATLVAVQEEVLQRGDYLWPWDDIDPEFLDDDETVSRPSSLAELAAAKESEEFWEAGTHTILDIHGIAAGDDDSAGVIRPLSAAELARVFGTERPSAADFDRVYQPDLVGPLGELMGARWTGRSVVIYRNGAPDEVYFWGYSGD